MLMQCRCDVRSLSSSSVSNLQQNVASCDVDDGRSEASIQAVWVVCGMTVDEKCCEL